MSLQGLFGAYKLYIKQSKRYILPPVKLGNISGASVSFDGHKRIADLGL